MGNKQNNATSTKNKEEISKIEIKMTNSYRKKQFRI